MPPKAAGSAKASAKKAKPVFDAFERVCQFTSVPAVDPAFANGGGGGSARSASVQSTSGKSGPASPAALAAQAINDLGEDGGHVAEFTASALTITPALPRTEVSLLVQFRVSVSLTEGDIIYIHLPKFRGPVAQQFALERVSAAALANSTGAGLVAGLSGTGGSGSVDHADDVNTSTHFRAYWSGDAPKVVTPVHQLVFKRGKKDGAPPKQVLLLQCTKAVSADTRLVFCVPRALGLMSPDKLPANSAKIKIEGPVIAEAGGRRILKQVILASTEIKKRTVVEELAIYDQCINQVGQDGRLRVDDRQLGEQLSQEEVDQLWQAAQYRRRYPLPMPWSIAEELIIPYDSAGGFVKRVIQNAIKVIKDFDSLAVHREVARNWGVKVVAVVVLDDLLTAQWGGLYPGLPRSSLFASCLLTMDPEDVGRTFPSLLTLPERSIAEDLVSAFRMRNSLTDAKAAARSSPQPQQAANGASKSGVDDSGLELVGGLRDRCGEVMDRWAALLTALLPASFVAEEATDAVRIKSGAASRSGGRSAGGGGAASRAGRVAEDHDAEGAAVAGAEVLADGTPRVGFHLPTQDDEVDDDDNLLSPGSVRGADGMPYTRDRRRRSSGGADHSLGVMATMQPPPTLYVGYRDVPFDVQRALRELEQGDWFVLPSIVVARQSLPYTATSTASPSRPPGHGSRGSSADGSRARGWGSMRRSASGGAAAAAMATAQADGAAAADDAMEEDDISDGAIVAIPDNAVVVELRNVAEALELADLSFGPHNRAWLLPLVTSCRVVSIEEDQHDVLHVVLDVHGSLVGEINDPFLPQSDRSVATLILRKYLHKAEQVDTYVSALSFMALLCARRNERRRLHPPTLIRAQYLSHCNAALRAAIAKHHVEETESVEWQVCTHEAQLLDEGVVKPAAWEAIPKKYMLTVEQFFLGHSRAVTRLEEGTLVVDLAAYTIDYGGKGPRTLRRVVQKVYTTHEPFTPETFAMLHDREEQYAKQLSTLDAKFGINTGGAAATTASATANGNGNGKKASKK